MNSFFRDDLDTTIEQYESISMSLSEESVAPTLSIYDTLSGMLLTVLFPVDPSCIYTQCTLLTPPRFCADECGVQSIASFDAASIDLPGFKVSWVPLSVTISVKKRE